MKVNNIEIERLLSAARRYCDAQEKRERQDVEIRSKGIIDFESPDRVELRREILGEANPSMTLERVIGRSDFLPSNYFPIGHRAASAVCRVNIMDEFERSLGFGTGSLVGESLLLTNQHVLEKPELALNSYIEFNFERGVDNFHMMQTVFELDPETFFYADADLDFALVAIRPMSRTGTSLAEFTPLRLIERSGKALVGESVTIVQHPLGGLKQVALRNNEVVDYVNDDFVHYTTDTEPGSSGSPVFNDQMLVVALHHAGVPASDGTHLLKKDGSPFLPHDDSSQLDWVANEGVRISAIFKHLRDTSRGWTPQEIVLLESQLGGSFGGLAGPPIVTEADPPSSPAPRIKVSELLDKIYDEQVTDEEMERYFMLSERSEGMAPMFEPNPAYVEDDEFETRESALALNAVNWWCRRQRQKRYKKHIRRNPNATRIVSEGDSWFQYPIKLDDVIDHLMDDERLAVLSFGYAGDLISNMVAQAEFMRALDTEQPEYFLISGAGNDLVGNEGLRQYVHNAGGNNPEAYLDMHKLRQFGSHITRLYKRLFQMVVLARPNIKILCHGYSYAIPKSGKWLGKPMEKEGITDRHMQERIVRIVMDEVGKSIKRALDSFPSNGTFLDLRQTVPSYGWHDELHPTSRYFGEVAKKFRAEIR